MAGLARVPTTLVVDESQSNGAPEASPAVPRSSQSRIERKDLHVVAFSNRRRGTARGPQAWQDGSATPGLPAVCRSRALLMLGSTVPPGWYLERW